MTNAKLAPLAPDTPELLFPALDCGCRPYFEAFTYGAWRQYGGQVRKGQRAQIVSGTNDRLFCACQIKAGREMITATVATPPARPVPVAELVPEPMTDAELAVVEAAEKFVAEADGSLLDDMLGSPSVERTPERAERWVQALPDPKPQPAPAKRQGKDLGALVAELAGRTDRR